MRSPVLLRHAYKLINHGPTTLISSAAGGKSNVMAAAWVMALDYDPARLVAVIEEDSYTRELIDRSGDFVVNVPTAAMVDKVYALGRVSGRDVDKFRAYGIATMPSTKVVAPLIEGCVAWLECRRIASPDTEAKYDLFLADVLAAWADDALYRDGEWRFADASTRTVHHMNKGAFLLIGDRLDAKPIEPLK